VVSAEVRLLSLLSKKRCSPFGHVSCAVSRQLVAPTCDGVTQMSRSLYYKFVAVRWARFLSSSPRRLSIHSFSKALVGEHRALTFLYAMAMIMTPHAAQTFRSHAYCIHINSDHMNIFEHALLHESHYPCSCGIYYFLCSVCPD
jgi:hypothetical protein